MARPQPKPGAAAQIFAPGARVEVRGEEWIVRSAAQTSTGDTAVEVTGCSELVRDKNAIFLTDIDREMRVLEPEETALVPDPSPGYRRTRLYLESLLRQSPPTDARLYRGHRGAMDSADYQLVPAGKALAQPRPRILIADAVGLGKTLEVGVLLSELIRRGRGRRILVVALKSMLEQFQEELWARFTIPLVRLDSVGLERVQRKIPANHNPFHHFDRVIISVDTLKKDTKYRRFLETCHWDAVVVDECQHVAVRDRGSAGKRSQRAKLAELLGRTSDALILTSATPHDGKKESFASLMNLLEPTAVADDQDYSAEDVQGLFVRRFKKDVRGQVGEALKERRIHPHHVHVSASEDAVFELLETASFKTIQPRRRFAQAKAKSGAGHGVLFRTLLLKAFLSSPEALSSTLQARLGHKRLKAKGEPGLDENEQDLDEDARHDVELLEALQRRVSRITPQQNTKLEQLTDLLMSFGVEKKGSVRVVVFSERIATLELLQGHLQKALKLDKRQVPLFTGTLDDKGQQQQVKDFGTEKSPVRVLLASDAASEGVNLHHFCHHLVHYDIPWSLITLEQRNGRIDRYGQTAEPQLHYLVTVPGREQSRGDLRVLDVLIEKENGAHKNLGDVRWLMNLHDPEAEEERIAEGIGHGESPARIIPEAEPEADFLMTLMAAGAEDDSAALKPEDLVTAAPNSTRPPETASPLRLFQDDLEFAKEAFQELLDSQPPSLSSQTRLKEPQWEDHVQGFVLEAPLDLQQRYRYLPPELQRGKGWTFKLTGDRDQVQSALAASREKPDSWPEWELFWEQHPVAEWLNDRMAAHFRRHEAPVVQVQSGLEPGAVALVFQGVLSNQRSQPLVVEWFAVCFQGRKFDRVLPLAELVEKTAMKQALVNEGSPAMPDKLLELRGLAVAQARAHLSAARKSRRDSLLPELKASMGRLTHWARRKKSELDARESKATKDGRKLRADIQQRLQSARAEVDAQVAARKTWLTETMSTVETPYLRIVAVLVAAPGKERS